MRFWRALLAVLTASTLLVACGGDDGDEEASDQQETSETTAEEEAAEPEPVEAPEVEVLDAGQEPRSPLRFRPEEGAEQALTLRQEQRQEFRVAGSAQAVDAPATELDITNRVESADDDRIVVATEYQDSRVLPGPEADPAIVSQVEEVVAAFEGTSARTVLNPRGVVIEFEPPEPDLEGTAGDIADTLISSLGEQSSSLAVPFPEEPVGRGARWRVTSSAQIAGLNVDTAYELELTEVADTSAGANVQTAVTFVPGPVDLEGTQATVEGGSLTGGGQISWNLLGTASLAEQTIEGTTTIAADQGGQQATFELFQRQVLAITER